MVFILIGLVIALVCVFIFITKKRNIIIEKQNAVAAATQKLEALAANFNVDYFNQQIHHMLSEAIITHNYALKQDIEKVIALRYSIINRRISPIYAELNQLQMLLFAELNAILKFVESDKCKTLDWCGSKRNQFVKPLKTALRSHPITFFSAINSDSAPWLDLDQNFKNFSPNCYEEFFELLQNAIEVARVYWKVEKKLTNLKGLKAELDNLLEKEENLIQALDIQIPKH